jgi:fructose/tagatose bisphosphate aldolase
MIVPTAALYKLAYRQYAIGAYNINNLEQILGLFRGCTESFGIRFSASRQDVCSGIREIHRAKE